MVDSNGFDVPLKLCMVKVRISVNADGINTERRIACVRFLIFIAKFFATFHKNSAQQKCVTSLF